ncbi:uncharacterized protein LOC131876693 [Cryptomeria japonica]|uniref:uncharacterized protein LOC131876693 n=1 Tax=Cryptomeria japonica TaxID=3369 RepID=UPI0027DA850F|nr:uncharacterized protein LOC131876693 [Cryptomeria japonica]
MIWVTFLKETFEAFSKFKAFKSLAEKETGKNLKCLRSDWVGEFISTKFVKYCYEHGMKRQLSAPRTPQENGIAERRNQIIVEAARTMLIQGDVPKMFSREVFSIAVYTMNWVLVKKGKNKKSSHTKHEPNPALNFSAPRYTRSRSVAQKKMDQVKDIEVKDNILDTQIFEVKDLDSDIVNTMDSHAITIAMTPPPKVTRGTASSSTTPKWLTTLVTERQIMMNCREYTVQHREVTDYDDFAAHSVNENSSRLQGENL